MDMGLFSIQCVLIVELINFFAEAAFSRKNSSKNYFLRMIFSGSIITFIYQFIFTEGYSRCSDFYLMKIRF